MKLKALNKYIIDDARNLEKAIKEEAVDVTITSPPYANLKDYNANAQIGFGQNYTKEYLPALADVFGQCLRVTKKTGSLWLVSDTFKKRGVIQLLPFHIADLCSEAGWKLRDIIIWDKTKSLPWSSKGRLRNTFEYILFFTKTHHYKYYIDRIKDPIDLKQWWIKYPERYALGGKVPSNIWRIPIPTQGSWNRNAIRHFCPFPPELVEKLILLTTDEGDVVMDPFAGSGVVLAQAFHMKRKYIGFDVNKEYASQFNKIVISLVGKKWESSKAEMKTLINRRKIFQKNIVQLRKLKYPCFLAKMTKSLSKAQESPLKKLAAILIEDNVRVNDNNKSSLMPGNPKYIFIFNNSLSGTTIKTIKGQIGRLISKPPLSKYGVRACFEFIGIANLISKINTYFKHVNKLALYLNGKFYYYHRLLDKRSIHKAIGFGEKHLTSDEKIPPIISDIRIRQILPRCEKTSNITKRG